MKKKKKESWNGIVNVPPATNEVDGTIVLYRIQYDIDLFVICKRMRVMNLMPKQNVRVGKGLLLKY